ncbi:TetR/AcrR family transcriptional regulator [Streptomyces sp. NBC_01390]|uniref:TetR/AcrR family transcriptional regulator n=1 Tax=Streptomyces sp. NBC_01390 TaxID=2903850 RepID=UPI0032499C39
MNLADGPADAATTARTPADGTPADRSTADRSPADRSSARGRPRSEAVERAIIEGVLRLLEEGVPLADISIERVARTAGVGKATIYRRWSGKEELFVDVMRVMEPADPELPGTSTRDDLVVLLEALRRRGLANQSSAFMHNVQAQVKSSPKLWAAYQATVIEPRRLLGAELLRRGQLTGEVRPDVDVTMMYDLFVGPMLLRAVLRTDADLPEGLAEQIVDTLLEGLRPVAP